MRRDGLDRFEIDAHRQQIGTGPALLDCAPGLDRPQRSVPLEGEALRKDSLGDWLLLELVLGIIDDSDGA